MVTTVPPLQAMTKLPDAQHLEVGTGVGIA
jgi:hypothetical protein